MFSQDADNSLRAFTNDLLRQADINIDDYSFESRDAEKDDLLRQMPTGVRELFSALPMTAGKEYRVSTMHNIHSQDDEQIYALPLQLESKGTRDVFLLSPILKHAFETGEAVCIDEFDTSLHPLLVRYLVSLFHNPEVNKANAQLIISTHDLSLLTLKILRRDQIYFIEKSNDTGASELYSLDEFSPRTNEDVRKGYMLGRYGSVPNIGEGDLLWQ